jgi:hypothetical protein
VREQRGDIHMRGSRYSSEIRIPVFFSLLLSVMFVLGCENVCRKSADHVVLCLEMTCSADEASPACLMLTPLRDTRESQEQDACKGDYREWIQSYLEHDCEMVVELLLEEGSGLSEPIVESE